MNAFKLALFTAFCTALAVAATPREAQAAIEYPWCVQYSSGEDSGGRNCGFVSYEQCMETARGAGAACEQNLFYRDQIAKQKQPARKRPTPN